MARRCSRGTTRISEGSWATDIARRADQAGVRKQARDVAGPPFHDLVQPGAAIDEDGDAAREHDEQALHGRALRREHVAHVQLPNGPVRGQPRELLARRRAEGLVLRQPIDEIGRSHGSDTRGRILYPAPTTTETKPRERRSLRCASEELPGAEGRPASMGSELSGEPCRTRTYNRRTLLAHFAHFTGCPRPRSGYLGHEGAHSRAHSRGAAATPAEALVDQFSTWLRGPGYRRASTSRLYARHLRAFLSEMKVREWADVSVGLLDEYVYRMQLRKTKPSTQRAHLIAIRRFYGWAHARDFVPRNVATPELRPLPRDDRATRPVVTLEEPELERLFNVVHPVPVRWHRGRVWEPEKFFEKRRRIYAGRTERDQALALVAFEGALRISEAAGALWADLTPDPLGRPTRDAFGRDTARLVLRVTKGNANPATIFLSRRATAALLRHDAARRAAGITDPRIFPHSPKQLARICTPWTFFDGVGSQRWKCSMISAGPSLAKPRVIGMPIRRRSALGFGDL